MTEDEIRAEIEKIIDRANWAGYNRGVAHRSRSKREVVSSLEHQRISEREAAIMADRLAERLRSLIVNAAVLAASGATANEAVEWSGDI